METSNLIQPEVSVKSFFPTLLILKSLYSRSKPAAIFDVNSEELWTKWHCACAQKRKRHYAGFLRSPHWLSSCVEAGHRETSVDSGGARSESVCHREKGLVKLINNRWFIRRLLLGISRGTLSCYVLVIQRVAAIRWTSQRAVFPQDGPVFWSVCVESVKRRHTSASVTGHRGHACNCILSSQGSCSTPFDLTSHYPHLYFAPLHAVFLQSRFILCVALC